MLPFHRTAGASSPLAPTGRHRIVCLGDSQVANNQDVSGTDRIWNSSLGWMGWAMQRTNQTLDWAGNFGYAGQQIPTVVANGLSQALALNPGWMVLAGGGNDLDGGAQPVAVVKERILSLITTVTSLGINAIWILMAPSSVKTLALANSNHEINGYVKSLAGRVRGLYVCDMARYTSNVDGYLAAAYTGDNTHFNAAGGYVGGQALAELLLPILPRVNRLPSANPAQELPNITLNPMMAGTTGTKTGAGVTGTVPTSWTVADNGGTSTTACSVQAADASDLDQTPWLRVAISAPGAGGIRVSVLDTAATKWAVGDGFKYEFTAEVRVTAGFSGEFIQAFLRMETGASSSVFRCWDLFINNTPVWPGESAAMPHRQWVTRTFPAVIPTGLSIAQLRGGFDIKGIGTVDIRRATVRRYRDV